ncbi:antitoxin [Candidatus Roizmanbacteria bacterium]|nr:antitoxin [Candidatus Roizmanbacteria bacterium]
MKKNLFEPLDNEEKELLDVLEQEEMQTADDEKKLLTEAKEAAVNYLEKNKNINIRLSTSDVYKLKRRAAEAGMPYQTLVSSVLHQFVNDKIKTSY